MAKGKQRPRRAVLYKWLNTSRLCSSSLTPHASQVCISALLLSWMNRLFSCVLSHTLCFVSNHKCWTCFYSFCLLETVLLTNRGKSPGHFCFSPLVPGGLVARTLSFHPGSPGLIPGQGTRISPSEISIIPAPMQSETLIFLYCFPVWLSPRPFPGLGQSRKEAWVEAESTRKGGCLQHAKVKNSFLLTIFQTEQALLSEKLETSTSEQWSRQARAHSVLSCLTNLDSWKMSFTLTWVMHLEVEQIHYLQVDVYSVSLPFSLLFSIHWSLRQTSCPDRVVGSR